MEDVQMYSGIPLDDSRHISESPFGLFPEGVGCVTGPSNLCASGISSDGKVLFFLNQKSGSAGISENGFALQHLGNRGRPIGIPVIAAKGKNVIPMDVSGVVSQNRRFLLYTNSFSSPKLFLQAVDADSFAKIGNQILISSDIYILGQTAAIDPTGHFVTYIANGGSRILFFQAIDILGQPSGVPKIIATKIVSGIDILKD